MRRERRGRKKSRKIGKKSNNDITKKVVEQERASVRIDEKFWKIEEEKCDLLGRPYIILREKLMRESVSKVFS